MNESLPGQTILITGAARRVGRIFALTCAPAGADIVLHHGHSDKEVEGVRDHRVEASCTDFQSGLGRPIAK